MRERCILMLVVLLFLSACFSVYAEEEKNWEFKNHQTVRINTRDEDDSAYLTRLAAIYRCKPWNKVAAELEFQPFTETRYLWDEEEWARTETGAETGFRFGEWAYVGESIHYAWLKGAEDTPELETRIEAYVPIVLTSKGYRITLTLLEEYTFSTEEGEATRNEIAALFKMPVVEHLDFLCGWRHVDRIHGFDSDQVELSAVIKF